MPTDFSDVMRVMSRRGTNPARFMAVLEDVSAETLTCRLRICTGTIVEVPASVLSKCEPRGRIERNGVSENLVLVEVDTDSEVGRLVSQLANEIDRLVHELRSSQELLLKASATESTPPQREQTITPPSGNAFVDFRGVERVNVPVSGYACQVNIGNFTPDRDIAAFSLAGSQYCQVAKVERLSARWLRIYHGAPNGSICGGQYSGKVFLDVQWA